MKNWLFPLWNCNGIPINYHPGAFGFARRKNYHTGVDLYTTDGELVYACEDGVVVHIEQFTGPELGHDWWLPTWGVMVEGETGVINYGELYQSSMLEVGCVIKRGNIIGKVKQVIKDGRERPDIEGHSKSMLHLELYKRGARDFAHWHPNRDVNLLDPTPYLISADGRRPKKFLSWENSTGQNAG